MLVKLLIAFLIFVGCTYIGFTIFLYYKKRDKFFGDLVDFLQHAKTQISFFENPLKNVFESFSCDGDLNKLLKQKALLVSGEHGCVKKPIYILENEWQWINGFLNGLGKCDVEREIDGLMAILDKASESKSKAQFELERKGAATIKLGLVFGLALAIIVI